jgi:hypothetical protein
MSLLKQALHQKQHQQAIEENVSDVRVAICVPSRDMVHTVFAFGLAELMAYNTQKGINTSVHFNMGTLVVNQRETLVQQALEVGATHIMWIDSDMKFPKDVIEKLLLHNKPVVAGNYATRRSPYKTVAFKKILDWRSYLVHNKDDKGLTEVEGIGMGMMLERTDVYKLLPKPWFSLEYQAKSNDHMGEDMYHCRALKTQGYTVYVDHEISKKLGHIGSFAYTVSMVEANLE